MPTEDSTFPKSFLPINNLNENSGERKDENGDETVLESEKHNEQEPKDPGERKVGRDCAIHANNPRAFTEPQTMNQSLDAERVFRIPGPTANVHAMNEPTNDKEAFFAHQEHLLVGMTSTVQSKPFPMKQPASCTLRDTAHRRHLPTSGGIEAPVAGYCPWPRTSRIQAPSTYVPLPFTTTSVTAFQSIGPLQTLAVAATKTQPSFPMSMRLPSAGPTHALVEDAAKSQKKATVCVEQFRGINYNAVQVSTKMEACKWLARFKQFVLYHEAKTAKSTTIRRWLKAQQKFNLCGELNPERKTLLAKYGVFNNVKPRTFNETPARRAKWMNQYENLKNFHLSHGNVDKSLILWIKRQRQSYRAWKDGLLNMPVYRIEKLEELGFEWS